jgi:hypothetical protein
VLNFSITDSFITFSCNYSIIIVFINTLRYSFININILYYFNIIEIIILILFLI